MNLHSYTVSASSQETLICTSIFYNSLHNYQKWAVVDDNFFESKNMKGFFNLKSWEVQLQTVKHTVKLLTKYFLSSIEAALVNNFSSFVW